MLQQTFVSLFLLNIFSGSICTSKGRVDAGTYATYALRIRQKTHLMSVTGSDQPRIKENLILSKQPRTISPFSKP